MKSSFFTILLLVILSGYSQLHGQTCRQLFDSAGTLYENDSLESSLNLFIKITHDYPNDSSYSRAFYNVGYIAWQLKKYDIAKKTFLTILASNFNDNEKGPGEGIMSEPYALYKHRASAILSTICLENNEFTDALNYLKLSDKKYPYKHFCGNELAENEIITDVQYSKCYDGLNNTDTAINVLWADIFNYGLADNTEVIEQMKKILIKKYSKQQIVDSLLAATKTITIESDKENGYDTGYILIFGNKIILPNREDEVLMSNNKYTYDDFNKLTPLEQYRVVYTQSEFYTSFVN